MEQEDYFKRQIDQLGRALGKILAAIFFLLAEACDNVPSDSEKKRNYYERSLAIYQHLDKTGLTYSFDRRMRMEKIIRAL